MSHSELKGTLNSARHWFKSARHLFNRVHKMSHPELKGTLNNVTARIKRNIKQCQTLV